MPQSKEAKTPTLRQVESLYRLPSGELIRTQVWAWVSGGMVQKWWRPHLCPWERIQRNVDQEN